MSPCLRAMTDGSNHKFCPWLSCWLLVLRSHLPTGLRWVLTDSTHYPLASSKYSACVLWCQHFFGVNKSSTASMPASFFCHLSCPPLCSLFLDFWHLHCLFPYICLRHESAPSLSLFFSHLLEVSVFVFALHLLDFCYCLCLLNFSCKSILFVEYCLVVRWEITNSMCGERLP